MKNLNRMKYFFANKDNPGFNERLEGILPDFSNWVDIIDFGVSLNRFVGELL